MQLLAMRVAPFAFRYQGLPPANILIPIERQLIALQLCRWQFLYNETLQQTFRPLLSKLSKRRQMSVIYPHFEEVMGGVEIWLMARWKPRVEFLLSVIELLFLSLTVEALQGKMCTDAGSSVSVSKLLRRVLCTVYAVFQCLYFVSSWL